MINNKNQLLIIGFILRFLKTNEVTKYFKNFKFVNYALANLNSASEGRIYFGFN